jgi:hypothetical protein
MDKKIVSIGNKSELIRLEFLINLGNPTSGSKYSKKLLPSMMDSRGPEE